MILAAGLGTRLKPWTDKHPKALALVNRKTLLERNIEYLQSYGIYDVVINVHHFADQIIDAVQENKGWGSRITISDETLEVLETGGGLKKAQPYLERSDFFVLMNVDILTDLNLSDMLEKHHLNKSLVTLAVSERESSRYFLFNEKDILCGWKNIKTGSSIITRDSKILYEKAFSGVHVISSSIFPLITQEGKFSIVDTYLKLSATHNITGYDHTGCKMIDVGKPDSIEKAEQLF